MVRSFFQPLTAVRHEVVFFFFSSFTTRFLLYVLLNTRSRSESRLTLILETNAPGGGKNEEEGVCLFQKWASSPQPSRPSPLKQRSLSASSGNPCWLVVVSKKLPCSNIKIQTSAWLEAHTKSTCLILKFLTAASSNRLKKTAGWLFGFSSFFFFFSKLHVDLASEFSTSTHERAAGPHFVPGAIPGRRWLRLVRSAASCLRVGHKKICLTLKGAVDGPTWCPRRPEHSQNSAEANRQSPTADTPCFMSHPWMYSKNWMRCHYSAGTKTFPVANRGIARKKMA